MDSDTSSGVLQLIGTLCKYAGAVVDEDKSWAAMATAIIRHAPFVVLEVTQSHYSLYLALIVRVLLVLLAG